MTQQVTTCLLFFLFCTTLLLPPANANAADCCNPYTHLCVMLFDPACDINACTDMCSEDIVINNGVDNRLYCDPGFPYVPNLQLCAHTLTILSGSLEPVGLIIR